MVALGFPQGAATMASLLGICKKKRGVGAASLVCALSHGDDNSEEQIIK